MAIPTEAAAWLGPYQNADGVYYMPSGKQKWTVVIKRNLCLALNRRLQNAEIIPRRFPAAILTFTHELIHVRHPSWPEFSVERRASEDSRNWKAGRLVRAPAGWKTLGRPYFNLRHREQRQLRPKIVAFHKNLPPQYTDVPPVPDRDGDSVPDYTDPYPDDPTRP